MVNLSYLTVQKDWLPQILNEAFKIRVDERWGGGRHRNDLKRVKLFLIFYWVGTVWCKMGIVFTERSSRTSRDKGNFLDYILYESKCVRIINMMTLVLYNTIRKCIPTLQALKLNFMSSLLLCTAFL